MTISATLRCYAELNDGLPREKKQRSFRVSLEQPTSISRVLQQTGISPGDVDLVLVNSESVGLCHDIRDGDVVSLYPVFESVDISPIVKLRKNPLRIPRFVVDVHLGKLAKHLRMLGFDTLYSNDYQDEELVSMSVAERRTLLSSDRTLLEREELTRRYAVLDNNPEAQLVDVLKRFDLTGSINPFTRCIECNALLEPVGKQTVFSRLPEKVQLLFERFRMCRYCDRVYWDGSHVERMQAFIARVVQVALDPQWSYTGGSGHPH